MENIFEIYHTYMKYLPCVITYNLDSLTFLEQAL